MSASGLGGAAPVAPDSRPSHAQQGNPLGQYPNFFHRLRWMLWGRNQNLQLMRTERPGIVRRWWTGSSCPVGAEPPFSWARNSFDAEGAPMAAATSPIRYLVSDRRPAWEGGNQLSNPEARAVVPFMRSDGNPPLIRAGNAPSRPTVRSRLTSFGQRVPPLNNPYPSEAEGGG